MTTAQLLLALLGVLAVNALAIVTWIGIQPNAWSDER